MSKKATVIILAFSLFAGLNCTTFQKSSEGAALNYLNISEKDEYLIGRATAGKILARYKLVHNRKATEYVNLVGQYLAANSNRPFLYRGYHFGILDTDKTIAVSTPGGYVFVSRGLIIHLNSEDELAAVLAHEIGHVSRKDGLSYIKAASVAQMAEKGINILAKKKIKNRNIRLVSNISTKIMTVLMQKGFSRKQEFGADRAAVSVLDKSGYSSHALIEVLEKFKNMQNKRGIQILKTHPYPDARINALIGVVHKKIIPQDREQRFLNFKEQLAK